MLKIVNVDYISDFKLILAFNDGFEGIVNLETLFSEDPFNQFKDDFLCFSLTDGTLCWGSDMHISPEYLRGIAKEHSTGNLYIDPNNPLEVITKAFQESLEEDDPAILQAALRDYAEKLGMSNSARTVNVKNCSNACRAFAETSSPKWETLVKLANSIIELSKHEQNKTSAGI